MKKNYKEEVKKFWNDNKSKIKVGAKCLAIGYIIGIAKGVLLESKISAETINNLINHGDGCTLVALDDISLEDVLRGMSREELIDIADGFVKDGIMTK